MARQLNGAGGGNEAARRVGILLSEIAQLAGVFEHLGAHIVEHASISEEQVTMDGVCVRELAGKLGWMADLAAREHDSGAVQARGDATQWMLPRSYHDQDGSQASARAAIANAIDNAQGSMLAFGLPEDVVGQLFCEMECLSESEDPRLRDVAVNLARTLGSLDGGKASGLRLVASDHEPGAQ